MDVVIAGGHGKVARHLARRLIARGDRVRGLIRNPDHADDLRGDGTEPVLCDPAGAAGEQDDAGGGPGSGAERKLTIDRDGAIKLVAAARGANVDRDVMVSSIGAEDPPDDDDVFSVYLHAKADADHALAQSDRAGTILRPG